MRFTPPADCRHFRQRFEAADYHFFYCFIFDFRRRVGLRL